MQKSLESIIPTVKPGDEFKSKHGHYSFIVREINEGKAKIDRYGLNGKEADEINVDKIITQMKEGIILKK